MVTLYVGLIAFAIVVGERARKRMERDRAEAMRSWLVHQREVLAEVVRLEREQGNGDA